MKKSPTISVIMPVYNAEKYLIQAIESILKQTYEDFEFIIINDGSTDKSLEIIKKYESEDERIILVNRENKGLIVSLNEGIKLSQGKYIARMDADDISLPERFEEQIKLMESENLDICGGDFIIISENADVIKYAIMPKTKYEIILTMGFNVPFAHPTVMIRTEFLIKNNLSYGINGKKYAEDLDMWLNMYKLGAKFGNLDKVVLKYRILQTSLSRVNSRKIRKETNLAYKNFINLNKSIYKNSLIRLLNLDNLSNNQEKILLKGILIYSKIEIELPLILKILRKLKIKNILFVIASKIFGVVK